MSRLRIAAFVMTGVFALWTYYQLNDPDAGFWEFVYGAAALVSLAYAVGYLPRPIPALYGAFALGYGLYLAYRVIAYGQFFFDEEGREMMGSLIVAIWMGVLYFRGYADPAVAPASSDSPTDRIDHETP